MGGFLAPEAAAKQRNLVIFGDSVIADPPLGQYLARKVEQGSSEFVGGRFCPTSRSSFGVQAAAELRLEPMDYSCAGATALGGRSIFGGQDFAVQVDRALADATLSPATDRVLITVGFNDTYNNLTLPGHELRSRFVAAMVPQIERIRRVAPEARIQLVGYPTIADEGHVCLFNLGGSVRDRTYAPVIGHLEDLAQTMQQDLAAATGVEFLDLKPSTVDNGMCAPDHLRGWAGLIDLNASPYHLPSHLNARGHEYVAEVIVGS
ncbi:GDSL-type esterase/lipase family protein [Corynebacterium hylobatis]|nr:GDSL-type esterase/lipase family protein [Corynebacterium hylobatis]